MGVNTNLYLNSRWSLDDIKKVIERTQDKPVTVKSNHEISTGYFYFAVGERMINVFATGNTPIGTCTHLSLRADDEAHKIFKDIAKILGGIIEYFDSDGKCEMIQGQMYEEDGIPYFVKYAILIDGIDNHNFKGLITSISKWYDRCDSAHKPPIIETLNNQVESERYRSDRSKVKAAQHG